MKPVIKKIFILFLILLFILSGCATSQYVLQQERDSTDDDIIIAVPVPLEFAETNTKFLQGIKLAQEEINQKGINGRKIRLKIVDDQANFKTAVDLAQSFSKEPDVLAVIGHWYSDICLPVAKIYEEAQILNLVPTVSNPELTKKGYNYVFQSITSDKKIAEKMCIYAKNKGYDRVVVCYEDSSYGENMAKAIDEEAESNGLMIVDRRSNLISKEQFQSAYEKWKALEFQAVLLALNKQEAVDFIKWLRQMDEEATVIGADGLDVEGFIQTLGQDAEGVVIFTTYNPYDSNDLLENFTNNFQEKYQEQPDVWAIQGYESLQLIIHGIEKTGDYSSKVLADHLHQMEPWPSVSGTISFNEKGEIEGRKIYAKEVVQGQFRYSD